MKLIVSRNILENVDGVGKAEVMITLKSSKESVLNKDLSEEKQTEEERSGLTQLIKDITPKKIYITPQSRSGEQSYNIDYSGKRSVRYTVKSSGLIIILNNEFPFQHSVWKIGDYAVIIQYINSMVDR